MLRCLLSIRRNVGYRWISSEAALKVNPLETSYKEQMQRDWQSAKPFKELPGPTRWQIWKGFQNGGEFAQLDMQQLMMLYRKRYGDTFLLPGLFGMASNVVTFSVSGFEKIFRTEGQWPVRPGADALIHYRKHRADGLFNDCLGLISNGEEWARHRSAANPVLMQHRNAALYLEPMQRVNQQFVKRVQEIRDKQTLEMPENFLKEIKKLTFESIAVVALDRQLGLIRQAEQSPEALKLFDNIEIFTKSFYELSMKPSLYKYIATPKYRRFSKAMDEIVDICSIYINEALQRIEQKSVESCSTISVLEQLVRVDRKFAIILAIDMLMGGVDTTSSALSAIILNLAKNPDKQQKLREEILSKLPQPTQEFSLNQMKSLPYLRACIKEAMRIYPVTFGNLRSAGQDIVLDGFRIPKDTRIIMNSHMLLSDEQFYIRAKEFLPERWLRSQQKDDNTESLIADNLSPFIYLPFGFGPRMCVGKRIVDMEMELTIANLVRNFHIEFNHSTANAFAARMVNTPVIPLKFKFTDIEYTQ